MPKNKNKKKDKKLRQSIEILKAQLNVTQEVVKKPNTMKSETGSSASKKIDVVDDAVVKKDLIKTMVLSAVSFSVILLLWAFDISSFSL